MKFLKNEEINAIKEFIRKENVRLLQKYFFTKDLNEKISILKEIKDNNEYLYVNEKIKGATR